MVKLQPFGPTLWQACTGLSHCSGCDWQRPLLGLRLLTIVFKPSELPQHQTMLQHPFPPSRHSKNIIHGDLKPDNVLLLEDSTVPQQCIAKVCECLRAVVEEPAGMIGLMLPALPACSLSFCDWAFGACLPSDPPHPLHCYVHPRALCSWLTLG